MGVGEFVDEYRTAAVEFVTRFIDHLISSDDGGCVFAFLFCFIADSLELGAFSYCGWFIYYPTFAIG